MESGSQRWSRQRSDGAGVTVFPAWRAGAASLSVLVLALLAASGVSSSSPKKYTMPGETCGYIVDKGDQFKVESRRLQPQNSGEKASYPDGVSCTIIFRTDPNKRNFLRLSHFEVESSKFCTRDGLYLYDGGREDADMILSANKHALCGTTLSLPNYFVTKTHEVTLKFVTDYHNNSYGGFTVLITPFEVVDECDGFLCTMTKRCITAEALCNNEYQCEDGSDEPPNCHLYNTGSRSSCPWSQSSWAMVLASSVVVAFHGLLAGTRLRP